MIGIGGVFGISESGQPEKVGFLMCALAVFVADLATEPGWME